MAASVLALVFTVTGCASRGATTPLVAHPVTSEPQPPPAASPSSEKPAADSITEAKGTNAPVGAETADDGVPVYGHAPSVSADANAQVASVAAALRDKNHPERLSPMIAPAPFDQETYRKDPAAYLGVVEPGRVYQVAQPGPDVPRIEAIGATRANVVQGNSVPLRVRAPAGMPVTFTSMDLGAFAENSLTSITVAADDTGVAQATFVATPGTIADVRILAACPVAAGQIVFTVYVTKN